MMITNINLSDIVKNENQPRTYFNEEAIAELSESIKKDGLMQPITVRKVSRHTKELYEIVQGERRYRACKLIGMVEVPAFVQELNDEDAFHLSVIENIQRENMTAIEEAKAFQRYVEMGYKHKEIAEKVSKSRDYVSSRLRLLKLSPFVHDWIAGGFLKEGHGIQLLKLESIMNRLLRNATIAEDTPFDYIQNLFFKDFWYDEAKGQRVSVAEVKSWGEIFRFRLIKAIVSQLRGDVDNVAGHSMGYELSPEMFCRMYNLDPSLLNEDDYIFAAEYERNYFKDSFNDEFRPWMLERYWDEARTLTEWTSPRDLKLSDMKKKTVKERSLDELTESIKKEMGKVELAKGQMVQAYYEASRMDSTSGGREAARKEAKILEEMGVMEYVEKYLQDEKVSCDTK